MATPRAKRQKVEQKYREEYNAMWTFIQKSKLSDSHVRCTMCDTDFTVKSGGAHDIERHIASKKHQQWVSVKSKLTSVSSFFKTTNSGSPLDHNVTKAEMLFNKFVVEHNLPIAAFDHAGDLFQQMFPDSEIAKKFSCARSKATAITKVLANDISNSTAERMREAPFSLATDGSNDAGEGQLYPVVVRSFDEEKGRVTTDLLSVSVCKGNSTGENIFNVLDKDLKERNISWDNCISFACDNASVMTGVHKGVGAFIHKENENVYINGCPCHLLHLAAKSANKELCVDIEEQLVDVYFYLDKSSKRKKEFEQFQLKCGVELHKIIKHGATRWLSLHACVERMLEQWDPLRLFFKSEVDALSSNEKDSSKRARLRRINKFFENGSSQLYCLFLKENLPLFTNPNLQLQTESPQIHRLMSRLDELLTELMVRFVKPEAISKASTIFDVPYDDKKNMLSRRDLIMGMETRDLFEKMHGSLSFPAADEDKFVRDIKNFFRGATKYILSKFPLSDKLLQNAAVLDVSKRLVNKYSMLDFFVKKYPALISSDLVKNLPLEFSKFQSEVLPEDILNEKRIDEQWHRIGQIRSVDNVLKFANLSKVMKGLCCLSHSNADTERIFSLVRKNHTEFRPSMSADTLSALLIQKVHMSSRNIVCHEHEFSKSLIAKAKSAYSESLKQK